MNKMTRSVPAEIRDRINRRVSAETLVERHNQSVMIALQREGYGPVEDVKVTEELFYGDCWGEAR